MNRPLEAVRRFGRFVHECFERPTLGSGLERLRVQAGRPLSFVLDAAFLRECFGELDRGPDEEMHFVTGVKADDDLIVPTRILRLEYDEVSPVGVTANPVSTWKALDQLANEGTELVGIYHIHPGSGKAATLPSRIDYATQERFESVGYRPLSCVFSRDGFVRCFMRRVRFVVKPHGNVEEVQRNVFKFETTAGLVPVRKPHAV